MKRLPKVFMVVPDLVFPLRSLRLRLSAFFGSSLFSVEYWRRIGGSQWLAEPVHVRIRFWKATARRLGNL